MDDLIARTAGAAAVLFDVDGTLYRQASLRRRMAVRLITHHLPRPRRGRRAMAALKAYRGAQEEMRDEGFVGAVETEQLRRAASASGLPVAEVAATVERWMEEVPLDEIRTCRRPGLIDLLEALADRDVPIAAVSDYPAARKLAALGVARYFDTTVCAQDPEVGVFKPNPRGLNVALARLGVAPHLAIYVGDRAEVDGAAAAAAGVRALILAADGTAVETGDPS
ncbi:MAG: HAD family hydrolase [Desertimonas sp.]